MATEETQKEKRKRPKHVTGPYLGCEHNPLREASPWRPEERLKTALSMLGFISVYLRLSPFVNSCFKSELKLKLASFRLLSGGRAYGGGGPLAWELMCKDVLAVTCQTEDSPLLCWTGSLICALLCWTQQTLPSACVRAHSRDSPRQRQESLRRLYDTQPVGGSEPASVEKPPVGYIS